MTDDKSLPKGERKRLQIEHAPSLSRHAKEIKIADKISNILDITHNPPAGWPPGEETGVPSNGQTRLRQAAAARTRDLIAGLTRC